MNECLIDVTLEGHIFLRSQPGVNIPCLQAQTCTTIKNSWLKIRKSVL